MRTRTRIIFTVYVLLVSLACIGIIAAAFDASTASALRRMISSIYPFTFWTIIWVLVAALFLVTGIALLFFRTSRKNKKAANAVITTVEGGSVSITVDALKELAGRYLSGIEGISVNNIDIFSPNVGTVNMKIGVSVGESVSIPQITAKIKQEIKPYIGDLTGLNIGQVDIDVQPVVAHQIVAK